MSRRVDWRGQFEGLKRVVRGVNLFGVQLDFEELFRSSDVDERISRLSEIKSDLEAAVLAVGVLEREAAVKKSEVETLRAAAEQAAESREAAEKLLKVPEELLARVIAKANTQGRLRGLIEGTLVGLLTGVASSYLVWFLTR